MPTSRHHTTILIAGGIVLFLVGVFGDGQVDVTDLRSAGIGSIVCGLMWRFTRNNQASDQAIWTQGNEIGYELGRRTQLHSARPVVVPITRAVAAGGEDVAACVLGAAAGRESVAVRPGGGGDGFDSPGWRQGGGGSAL